MEPPPDLDIFLNPVVLQVTCEAEEKSAELVRLI